MNRSALEHIIRAAGEIAQVKKVIILGSQSILAQFPDLSKLVSKFDQTEVAAKAQNREILSRSKEGLFKMNMQRRSDERSIALHQEVAEKLRRNPVLWDIPRKNLERWKQLQDGLSRALEEWERILQQKNQEQILALLESDSEEAIRLRSSSPFTGILHEDERKKIFESFSMKQDHKV